MSVKEKIGGIMSCIDRTNGPIGGGYSCIGEGVVLYGIEQKISALSKELLVGEARLMEKFRSDPETFEHYVGKKHTKYKAILAAAKEEYGHIAKGYLKAASGELVPLKDEGAMLAGLTDDLLMRVVRRALWRMAQKDGEDVVVVVKGKKMVLFAGRDRKGLLHLAVWSYLGNCAKLIGEGGSSKVRRVYNIAEATLSVVKVFRPKKQSSHKVVGDYLSNAHREVEKVDSLYEEGPPIGIVAPTKKLFYIKRERTPPLIAIMQKYYPEGDLFCAIHSGKFCSLGKRELLLLAIDLFSGLETLHKKMVHGDICEGNCLIERVDGLYRAVIADFGGAQFFGTEFLIGDPKKVLHCYDKDTSFGTTMSMGYFTWSDVREAKSADEKGEQARWEFISKKRDIFALATTIWAMIARRRPYDYSIIAFTQELYGEGQLIASVGAKVTAILARALHESPDERPGCSEILALLKEERESL